VLDAFDSDPDTDSDLPPWAVPGGIEPLRPARRPPRRPETGELDGPADLGGPDESSEPGQGPDQDADRPARLGRRAGRSRAAAARRRRSKRRLVTWGGAAIVVVLLVAGGLWATRSPAPKSHFVTTLQKGEYFSVPNACTVISPDALHRLLAGTPKRIQPYDDPGQSACTFQVDKQPTFRVLTLQVEAYTASLTALGNGSATANAQYNFAQKRNSLQRPSKKAPLPPATITPVSGLGSEALSAVQVVRTGQVTDLVTVLVRYRNVLISASMQAQSTGGFGPVTIGELRSGAMTVARTVFAAVKAERTFG
jgi:hypothetical protein